MEYKVLYRKYRPENFASVVGQDAIVTILKNSIISNKISHAYLFSGTRGTGKTSIAKILASTVNCLEPIDGEKCKKCSNCKALVDNSVDIIEIDAASNNGVDEIREIRNNAKLLPNIGKYKVYIIDEVHMLSIGAFNALLKTLEEPPSHVIFILATTELQKIPLTILSRCQKFEFKKIAEEEIYKRLKLIAKKEKIDINNDALKLISELSDGVLRDAINLLDQSSSDNLGKVNMENIYEISGIVPSIKLEEFTDNLLEYDTKKVLDFIEELSSTGKNYKLFCERLVDYLRNNLIKKVIKEGNTNDERKIILLIKTFIALITELKTSLSQKILFEVTMLELIEKIKESEMKENAPTIVELTEHITAKPVRTNIKKEEKNKEESEDKVEDLIKIRINNTLATADKKVLEELRKTHDEITNYISNKKYNNVATMLLDSKLIVASKNYLLYETNNKASTVLFRSNIELIEDLLFKIYKNKYKVACLTKTQWAEERKKYLESKKKNIKYKIIEEKESIEADNADKTEFEKNAISIFGKDTIKEN